MNPIRPLSKADLPQVAKLYVKVFKPKGHFSLDRLKLFFEKMCLQNPWFDEKFPSLVYQTNNGDIIGFLGVFPRPMVINGTPIQAVCGHNLMVDPDSRSSLAGMLIMKTFFSGSQDLTISDTGNEISRRLWKAFDGKTALLYSFHWTRILRPSLYILKKIVVLKNNFMISTLELALRPFCRLFDNFAARIQGFYRRLSKAPFLQEELDEESLLSCIAELSKDFSLHTTYDEATLRWIIQLADEAKDQGKLQKLLVRNSSQEIIGWYLYYLKAGEISEVLQIGAKQNSVNVVLDHLFYHAWKNGAVALRGRIEPTYSHEFSARHCYFHHDGPWMLIRSGDTEIEHAIHQGDAYLTRLDAEWLLQFSTE